MWLYLTFTMNQDDDAADVDLVQAFHDARDGAYALFFMPSFQIETTVATTHTGGTNTIITASSAAFNDTENKYGNWLYLWDTSASTGEILRISSISPPTITTVTNSNNSYAVGDYVEIAMLGRFDNDSFGKSGSRKGFWTPDQINIREVFEYGDVTL